MMFRVILSFMPSDMVEYLWFKIELWKFHISFDILTCFLPENNRYVLRCLLK